MDALRNFLAFGVILGGLIVIHELGHYVACLICGIQVKEFGLGLPPRLLKLGEWQGTTLSLNWIPLGGFVRPEGEFDSRMPKGLAASPAGRRITVFAAGPLANILAAYLFFTLGFMTGWPDQVEVFGTLPGSRAEAAGLQPADRILSINGQPIQYSDQLTQAIYVNFDRPLLLTLQRGSQQLTLTLIPRTPRTAQDWPAGVVTRNAYATYDLIEALSRASGQIGLQLQKTLTLPVRLWAAPTAQTPQVRLSGIVGLKEVSDKVMENATKWNEWYPILHFAAVVSTALGLTNLFPLPALDGGRTAFALLELVRGKAINARREKIVHAAGMVMLLTLMVALAVQDVVKPLF